MPIKWPRTDKQLALLYTFQSDLVSDKPEDLSSAASQPLRVNTFPKTKQPGSQLMFVQTTVSHVGATAQARVFKKKRKEKQSEKWQSRGVNATNELCTFTHGCSPRYLNIIYNKLKVARHQPLSLNDKLFAQLSHYITWDGHLVSSAFENIVSSLHR